MSKNTAPNKARRLWVAGTALTALSALITAAFVLRTTPAQANSAATAMTASSWVNPRTNHSGLIWQISVSAIISTLPMIVAERNVARTRSNNPAPTFWPATGDAANAIAIAGRKIACITRLPMPKPAWAVAPKSRIRV